MKFTRIQITLAVTFVILLLLLRYTSTRQEGFASGSDEFVLYYADWCPHCKTVKPVFKNWGAEKGSIQVNGKTVLVKMYEADTNPEEIKKADVKGFPTMILHKANGQKVEFEGDRSPSGWESWLKAHL